MKIINHPGKLFAITGPSGAGKTSLVSLLIANLTLPYRLERVVTYTSRPRRNGEYHSKDYYFVSEAEFKEKIDDGFFIEWSNAYGAYYGLPLTELDKLRQGISLIMILDAAGARHMVEKYQAVSIIIMPPDTKTLEERLASRNAEGLEDRAFRLRLDKEEFAAPDESCFDYRIVNIDMADALIEFEKLIATEMQPYSSSPECELLIS